jgi:hypothetical protein
MFKPCWMMQYIYHSILRYGCSIWRVHTLNGLAKLLVFASEKICVDEISKCTSFGDLVWNAFFKGVRLGLMRNLFCAVLIKEGSKVTWWDVVTLMIGFDLTIHCYKSKLEKNSLAIIFERGISYSSILTSQKMMIVDGQ